MKISTESFKYTFGNLDQLVPYKFGIRRILSQHFYFICATDATQSVAPIY